MLLRSNNTPLFVVCVCVCVGGGKRGLWFVVFTYVNSLSYLGPLKIGLCCREGCPQQFENIL